MYSGTIRTSTAAIYYIHSTLYEVLRNIIRRQPEGCAKVLIDMVAKQRNTAVTLFSRFCYVYVLLCCCCCIQRLKAECLWGGTWQGGECSTDWCTYAAHGGFRFILFGKQTTAREGKDNVLVFVVGIMEERVFCFLVPPSPPQASTSFHWYYGTLVC